MQKFRNTPRRKPFVTRGRLIAVFAAFSLILAACSSGASDEPDTTVATPAAETPAAVPDLGTLSVAVGAAQSIDFAPAELGLKLGVWERRGLTVENVWVRGGGEVARTMAANEASIGITTGPAVVAPILKGLPSKLVAAGSLGWTGFVIIVGADSDIQTVADLKGKTIGFSRPGSTTDYVAEKIAASQGWVMGEDVSKASIGGLSEMVAALTSGSIAAFTWTPEPAYLLEEQNEARIIGNMGDVIGANVFVSFSAADELISARPEVVQAYLEGWFETVQWMKDNPDEAITWMSDTWEMTSYAISKAFEAGVANLSVTGEIPDENLAGLAKTVADLDEEITTPPSPADYFDGQFLPVNAGS